MGRILAALLALSGLATTAQATLISKLSGQGDYDTDLDITWLANVNLAATNTFAVNRRSHMTVAIKPSVLLRHFASTLKISDV